jgi:hypothetical protein
VETLKAGVFRVILTFVFMALCAGASAQAPARSPLSADALQKLRDAATVEMPTPLALDPRIASLLKMGEDNEQLPSVRLTWLRPDGRHFIYFSLKDGTDDIVLSALSPGITRLYLTNFTCVLRAAGILEPVTGHTVPNDQAAAGFEDELKIWAASDVVR